MIELRKIKAIDPSLDTFNQLYRTKQPRPENYSDEENNQKQNLNELEILIEILSAADNVYKPPSNIPDIKINSQE